MVVFPGGVGTRPLEHDERVLEWVRRAHAGTRFTTSVCTGSLVLGAAGLLQGLTATTHWSCYRELAAHGAEPTPTRVVEHLDERIITAAGVSSGIDMALRLVELLADRTAAQAAQLMIEYDPQPPFDCGSVAKADDVVMTRVDGVRRAAGVSGAAAHRRRRRRPTAPGRDHVRCTPAASPGPTRPAPTAISGLKTPLRCSSVKRPWMIE